MDEGSIIVKDVDNRLMVDALIGPLGLGEAETIALTVKERADYVVLDDNLARRRAELMGLTVIGTLRVIRLMYSGVNSLAEMFLLPAYDGRWSVYSRNLEASKMETVNVNFCREIEN